MKDVRGIAFATSTILNGWKELDLHDIDNHEISLVSPKKTDSRTVIRLPSYEQVSEDRETYAHASRLLHIESNPGNARPLIQKHGNRNVWVTEPPIPLTTKDMDGVRQSSSSRLWGGQDPSLGDDPFFCQYNEGMLWRMLFLFDYRT